MLALHVPDGLIDAPVSAIMFAVAFAIVAVAIGRTGRDLDERRIPLAGLTAAFVFAAQMVNFPVAAGTSGHLIGGTLAAILLGPWLAVVVMTVVVFTQAVVFSDGGITALGLNVFNMAIVTTFGGFAAYTLWRRLLPKRGGAVVAGTGLAAATSVVLSAVAFSIEWLFGATAPVSFDKVFASMVGVHLLIGVGEGAISAFVVAAVIGARPDLVFDSAKLPDNLADRRIGWRPFVIASILTIVAIIAIGAPLASSQPDGLERTLQSYELDAPAAAPQTASGVLSDYAIDGVSNPAASRVVAALGGALVCAAVAAGMIRGRRAAQP